LILSEVEIEYDEYIWCVCFNVNWYVINVI